MKQLVNQLKRNTQKHNTYYAHPSPREPLICTAVNEKIIPQTFLVKFPTETTMLMQKLKLKSFPSSYLIKKNSPDAAFV